MKNESYWVDNYPVVAFHHILFLVRYYVLLQHVTHYDGYHWQYYFLVVFCLMMLLEMQLDHCNFIVVILFQVGTHDEAYKVSVTIKFRNAIRHTHAHNYQPKK